MVSFILIKLNCSKLFNRNGQLINKHDITVVSSPVGYKEKFDTCIPEIKKSNKPKRRYERHESILLPLRLYESQLAKDIPKSTRQLKEVMREKNIPTSYIEEIERKIPKREYYSSGLPSSFSYSLGKDKLNDTPIEVIKG